MVLRRVAFFAASLYAGFTHASPAPQIIAPGPIPTPKPLSIATLPALSPSVSQPAATPSASPSISIPSIATPIIATPLLATPILPPIPSTLSAVSSPFIQPLSLSGFTSIPSIVTPAGLFTSITPVAFPPTIATSFPSVAPLSSVSLPPVASAMVSSVLSAAPSVTAVPGLPTSLPIPSLDIDAVGLINQLSQSLQVLELIIGLLQTLAKSGEVVIPGIGPVGYAVEGVLINSLLKLVKGLIPTPST